jgi:hypothetical protein
MTTVTCTAHPWSPWPHPQCLAPGKDVLASLAQLADAVNLLATMAPHSPQARAWLDARPVIDWQAVTLPGWSLETGQF